MIELVVLNGAPGVGKSTVTARLRTLIAGARVARDSDREMSVNFAEMGAIVDTGSLAAERVWERGCVLRARDAAKP